MIEMPNKIRCVELVGTGREAMLSYDCSALDFSKTFVGNVYKRELIITNVGELAYPIELSIDSTVPELLQDFSIVPDRLELDAFEKQVVSVVYKAVRDVDTVYTPSIICIRYACIRIFLF